MRRTLTWLPAVLLVMAFCSCASVKKIPYFTNADEVDLAASRYLYDAKIMPKDILTITVNTTDPQASLPFNLSISSTLGTNNRLNTSTSQTLQTYLVDNRGNIRFPVIGDLHVVGLTVRECEEMIREKITPYMAASELPIVTVKMESFSVVVLGEVSKPGTVTASNEKMSLLEALAKSGDLTIYGRRDNVMLIREDAYGEKSVHRFDLQDANLMTSPYFYLQQNDVIYVEPNKVKAQNSSVGTFTTLSISLLSTIISITNLIVNLTD